MAFTKAKTGMGAIFSIGDGVDGGSVTYVKVGEVTSIISPAVLRETLDATHLESPDNFREHVPALLDTDPATITFNYEPVAIDPLYVALLAGKGDFQITYPNGVKMQFSGVPTKFKPGDTTAEAMAGEFVVKAYGKPVLVAA